MNIRPPAVAGAFYPGEAEPLARLVDDLLAAVPPADAPAPKVLIAPHAGYIYSGGMAAQAYARLSPARQHLRRVVLLGPTHRVAVQGMALPEADTFATPLGLVPLDRTACSALSKRSQIVRSDRVHALEHSLEVHLPFLQRCLDNFQLIPLAVGMATPEAVAEVIDLLWGGDETLIVVSTDLSHFHAYAQARSLDSATCRDIIDGSTHLHPEQACGAFPLNGLLLSTTRRGLKPELIACCNSGDTAGDKQRVVGYASFAINESQEITHD